MEGIYWLTTEEVAKYEGRSKRWVHRNRASLAFRMDGQKGRNGKPVPLYDANKMSPEARGRWMREKQINVQPIPEPDSDPRQRALDLVRLPDLPEMSEKQTKQVHYRIEVIRPVLRTLPRTSERRAAIKQQARITGQCERTIYDWVSRYEGTGIRGGLYSFERGLEGLADAQRVDKGKPKKLNEASLEFIASLQISGRYKCRHAWETYLEEVEWRDSMIGKEIGEGERLFLPHYYLFEGRLSAEAQMEACSREAFRLWWNEIPEPYKQLAQEEKEKFGVTQVSISHRRYADLKPMAYIHFDHRQCDVFCIVLDAQGKPKLIRPWITGAIDMSTRRWLGWVIVETPNSESILTVFRQVILEHGKPLFVYFDNGADFVSQLLTDVTHSLKVGVIHAKVKNARAKTIEPNFGRLKKFERLMPGFTGHKPDARPEQTGEQYEQHKKWLAGERQSTPLLTLDELRLRYDRFFEELNNTRCSGEGMKALMPDGERLMTPNECWAMRAADVPKEVISARTLALLMRERREVTVRQSEIRISYGGRSFHYRASARFGSDLALTKLNGKKVKLCIDPQDLGVGLVEYKEKLWCIAENLELRGMREEAFKEDEKLRRRQERMWRDVVKARGESLVAPSPMDFLERRAALRGEVPEPERPEVHPLYAEEEKLAAAMGDRPVTPAKVEVVKKEAVDPDEGRLDFHGDLYGPKDPESAG